MKEERERKKVKTKEGKEYEEENGMEPPETLIQKKKSREKSNRKNR